MNNSMYTTIPPELEDYYWEDQIIDNMDCPGEDDLQERYKQFQLYERSPAELSRWAQEMEEIQ